MKDINRKFTALLIELKNFTLDVFKLAYTICKYVLLALIGIILFFFIPFALFALVIPSPFDSVAVLIWSIAVILTLTRKF